MSVGNICVCVKSLLQHTCHAGNLQVMNVESDSILLRRMEFFHKYDIEVWLRKEVSASDCGVFCVRPGIHLPFMDVFAGPVCGHRQEDGHL